MSGEVNTSNVSRPHRLCWRQHSPLGRAARALCLDSAQGSNVMMNDLPLLATHSPSTSHHPHLTTHHPPLTFHSSPLTTHPSPLTTHHGTQHTAHSTTQPTHNPEMHRAVDEPKSLGAAYHRLSGNCEHVRWYIKVSLGAAIGGKRSGDTPTPAGWLLCKARMRLKFCLVAWLLQEATRDEMRDVCLTWTLPEIEWTRHLKEFDPLNLSKYEGDGGR